MTATADHAGRASLAPGYDVARVIGGCWQLSEGHRNDENGLDRDAVLDAFDQRADQGLTTFDCADIYTGVEALLGRLVARRHAAGKRPIEIHTKLVPDRSMLPKLDRRYLEGIVDRSLRRLGVERLDLVQFHWWDFAVPGWVQAMVWLDALRAAGKIGHLGVTNFDAENLAPVLEAGVRVVSNQVQYSLFDDRPRGALTELAARHDVHLIAYGTLAGGFLSRRWLGQPPPAEPLANRSLVKYRLIIEEAGGWDAYQELLAGLADLAAGKQQTLEEVATTAVLARPRVAAAIVGIRDGRHTDAHARTARCRLDGGDRRAIDRLSAELQPLGGPVYGLEREPRGRHAVIMKTELNRRVDPASGDRG